MRPDWLFAPPTAVLLAIAASGCAGADYQGTYASCLRDPRGYGDGVTRAGDLEGHRLETESYRWGPPDEKKFHASITRKDCKDSLTVTGLGLDFKGGPWLPLWEEHIATNYTTNRLAFEYYESEHQAYVWIDGKSRGPYYEIGVSPRFSEDGKHVAYLVHEAGGSYTLFADDSRTPNYPRVTDWPFLYVLGDGRMAAPNWREDKKVEIVVGEYRSPPLDELCSNWGFNAGPGGRWGFSAKHEDKWIIVVDGVTLPVSGMPSRCEIHFSEGGRHYGFIVHPVAGDPASKSGVVLDGAYHPELETASDLVFQGDLAIATALDLGGPAGVERVLHLVGRPTPQLAPTHDDYVPPEGPTPRTWVRAQIGDSLGPRMDTIDIKSFSVDGDGHVHYRGDRATGTFDLIDNVLRGVVPKAAVAQ